MALEILVSTTLLTLIEPIICALCSSQPFYSQISNGVYGEIEIMKTVQSQLDCANMALELDALAFSTYPDTGGFLCVVFKNVNFTHAAFGSQSFMLDARGLECCSGVTEPGKPKYFNWYWFSFSAQYRKASATPRTTNFVFLQQSHRPRSFLQQQQNPHAHLVNIFTVLLMKENNLFKVAIGLQIPEGEVWTKTGFMWADSSKAEFRQWLSLIGEPDNKTESDGPIVITVVNQAGFWQDESVKTVFKQAHHVACMVDPTDME
ncbi:hypothetical protein L596_026441 [Steinernema carpocapsae]|uniref:C-type lectin domain-containing protein n=1 Tax=Steinernema carpocapsae TaxID=34508 RepID=A0A4U5M1D5_STECR|nr:hypothetical protein L596_026441 [Steinernema carpocapsae]